MKRADTYHFLRSLRSTAVLVVATAALLASVLTSCSKQAEEPALRDGQIRIDAEIATSPQSASPQSTSPQSASRAAIVDGGAGAKAPLTDIRLLREDDTAVATTFTSFATATPQLYADRAASGALSFTPEQYYKKDNSTASYIAVYPAGEIINSVSKDKGLTWEIDGATDVLVSKVYDAGKYTAPASGTMVFEHHLALLKVICTADPSVSLNVVQAAWGEITKIELVNTHKKYVFYPDRLPNITGGTTPDARTLWNPGYGSQTLNVILGYYTTPCATGMFVPKSTTDPLTLRVSSTVGAAVEVEVQLKDGTTPKGFEAGKMHTVTLTFGAADKPIAVTTTSIQNWDEGGTGSGDGIVFEDVFLPSEGIIDMNYAELVKTGTVSSISYTATPTRRSYNPNTFAVDNAGNNGGYIVTNQFAIVEPAYYKFEVAKTDEPSATWATAWGLCKAKAPAGAWRLPRTMELALMGFNKAELEKTPGFTPLVDAYYWSGQEHSAGLGWLIRFPSISYGDKKSAYPVRCVRELYHPQVEDYYYSDGTFSRKLDPAKTVEGVIFWVDPTKPKHFKIVSMDEPPANFGDIPIAGYLKWSTESVARGVTSASDGKANTLALMKLTNVATEYHAAKWCYTRNAGLTVPAATGATISDADYKWYLPAKDELQHLSCAFLGVAPTTWTGYPSFSAASGYPDAWTERFTTTPFADDYHWSSSESDASNSWYITMNSGSMAANGRKTTGNRVRCVREITL